MNELIRVGLIGTSGYAELMHIRSIQSHPAARLVAICARNRQRSAELAEMYGIDHVYSDYREMIASGKLDAVVIAAPDRLHYPMALAALEAGLHTVCEKPLADNAQQAYDLVQKAQAAGVVNMVPFTWSWMPLNRHVQQLVREGYIGQLYHAEIRLIAGFGLGSQYNWGHDPKHSNGVVSDFGVHMFHLSRLFCGEATRVFGRLGANVRHTGPDGEALEPQNDTVTVLLDYAQGGHGTIQLSRVVGADTNVENTVLLYGSDGTLEMKINGGRPGTLLGKRSGEREFQTIEVPADAYGPLSQGTNAFEYFWKLSQEKTVGDRAFIDAIVNRCPLEPDFTDGWKAQLIVDAAIRSHQTGCWVEL
jgi:predicted dehydrogenase